MEKPREILPGVYVGDIIVSVDKQTDDHWRNGFITGCMAPVHESSGKGELVLYFNGKKCGTYWSNLNPDYLRKATAEETDAYRNGVRNINDIKKGFKYSFPKVPKFKIGDRIQIVDPEDDNRGIGFLYHTDAEPIESVGGRQCEITDFKHHKGEIYYNLKSLSDDEAIHEDCLFLINEDYKFGDFVKIVKDGYGCGTEDIGHISKLYNPVEVDAKYQCFGRRFAILSRDGSYCAVDKQAFEKIDPITPSESYQKNDIIVRKSASVTLKNAENEIVIKIKPVKTIKL